MLQQDTGPRVSIDQWLRVWEEADFSVSLILCSVKKTECCGYFIGLLWFNFQNWLIGKFEE